MALNNFIISMGEFLTELNIQFPNHKPIASTKAKFERMKGTPKMILDEFRESVDGYHDDIMNKNETVISELDEWDLQGIWSECSQGTKDAIWAHLNNLLLISEYIRNQAEGVLNTAENMLPFMTQNAMNDLTQIADKVKDKLQGRKPTVQDILGDADTMASIMSMADKIVQGAIEKK